MPPSKRKTKPRSRAKKPGQERPVTIEGKAVDRGLFLHPPFDLVKGFNGAMQSAIAQFFLPYYNDHIAWLTQSKFDSKDAIRDCFGEKMVPKTPKKRGRKVDSQLAASLQYFVAIPESHDPPEPLPRPVEKTPMGNPVAIVDTPVQHVADENSPPCTRSRSLRSHNTVKSTAASSSKASGSATTDACSTPKTTNFSKTERILTPARRVASPARVATTPDRSKLKALWRKEKVLQVLEFDRNEQIRKLDQKQQMAVKTKEEILREKTEKTKRDREERQRRVAENNAIREREELEKKRLIQERERTLNEFKRIQSPIRGAPPPRSPGTGRGPVGYLRPGLIAPSSPLPRPPPAKKPTVMQDARTENADRPGGTMGERDGDAGAARKKSLRLREGQKSRDGGEARGEQRERREEEEAKMRLKVADSSQLAKKLLDHVKQHTSYEMTPEKKPIPSSETNYGIEDLDSGDETDDDEAPRKKIPTWALGANLKKALFDQFHAQWDLEAMFGRLQAPPLETIFASANGRFKKRTSSANWNSPLADPRPGVSKFQANMQKS